MDPLALSGGFLFWGLLGCTGLDVRIPALNWVGCDHPPPNDFPIQHLPISLHLKIGFANLNF